MTFFDRFTDRARKVISLAQKAAEGYKHDYIGTEHLLLGLVNEGNGVAAIALSNLSVTAETVRREVEKLRDPGSKPSQNGPLPFTPQAKRVLELASEEARTLGHSYIGTEHILLGLLCERDSIASQALLQLNVTLAHVRDEILDLVGSGSVIWLICGATLDNRRVILTWAKDGPAAQRAMLILQQQNPPPTFAQLHAFPLHEWDPSKPDIPCEVALGQQAVHALAWIPSATSKLKARIQKKRPTLSQRKKQK